jgi:hypothetical protein
MTWHMPNPTHSNQMFSGAHDIRTQDEPRTNKCQLKLKATYHAISGFCDLQKSGRLNTFLLTLQWTWLVGFCQIAISFLWTSFLQHRLLATLSIWDCSARRSSRVLFQPFQWVSQLIGGPDRIQYPPGRRILSISIRYCPSAQNISQEINQIM